MVMLLISFDYAVVEHEAQIEVMRFGGMWKDMGTWNTLTDDFSANIICWSISSTKGLI